jgi:hypothetical protein
MDPDDSLLCSQHPDCGPCSHDMILVYTLQFHFFFLMHAISSFWVWRGLQIMFLFNLLLFGPSWVWIFSAEYCLSLSVIWLYSMNNVANLWLMPIQNNSAEYCLSLSVIWLYSMNNVTNLWLTPIQNNILVIMFIDSKLKNQRLWNFSPVYSAGEDCIEI